MSDRAPGPSAEEQALLKRAIYEKLAPRRRKYIDKIGYDAWDPFQAPQDPIDIRKDHNRMTAQELSRAFLQQVPAEHQNAEYTRGAQEICLGIINETEKALGMYDFVRWYLEAMGGQARPSRLAMFQPDEE